MPNPSTCELVAFKILLLRKELLDRAEYGLNEPEDTIRWTTGGSVKAGGPTAEKVRKAIGYSPEAMISLIAEAAALEL